MVGTQLRVIPVRIQLHRYDGLHSSVLEGLLYGAVPDYGLFYDHQRGDLLLGAIPGALEGKVLGGVVLPGFLDQVVVHI